MERRRREEQSLIVDTAGVAGYAIIAVIATDAVYIGHQAFWWDLRSPFVQERHPAHTKWIKTYSKESIMRSGGRRKSDIRNLGSGLQRRVARYCRNVDL